MADAGAIRATLRPSVGDLPAALRGFGMRGWLTALAAATGSAVLMGIPTVMFDNPWFRRMTPTRPQDYVFWLLSAALLGLIAGTYARRDGGDGEGRVLAGGFLSYLAIGCPICNKVVVLLLGVSGALTFFGPAQLFIGAGSVLLLAWTLLLRARAVAAPSCPLPVAR